MKNVIFVLSIALLIFSSCGNAAKENNETPVETTISPAEGTENTATENTELKDHICTDACKEKGACSFVCGEKGHTCTDACHAETSDLKEHSCTEACKTAGKCVTVCGEKGHTCSADCKG